MLIAAAAGTVGLCLPHPDRALASAVASRPAATADAVIQIFLEGGLSHLDTFDPKPQAPLEIRGEFGTVSTKIAGVQFSGLWGQTASVADKLAIIRSMTHDQMPHDRAGRLMLTGRSARDPSAPGIGSIVARSLAPRGEVPRYCVIPDLAGRDFAGAGSLGAEFEPVSAGDRIRDESTAAATVSQPASTMPSTQPATTFAHAATTQPFDLGAEPNPLRDAYGRTTVGRQLLAARRLVEAGVRFVTVFVGGWDMHIALAAGMRAVAPPVDQAVATLIRDLDGRGLLARTLVLVQTEFGRSPRLNRDRGRDHWPKVFSVLIAGGGIRAGQVIGSSSPDGAEPKDAPVRPLDLAATILTRLGIDPATSLASPGTQPADNAPPAPIKGLA